MWRNNIELIKCAFLLVKGNDCCCNREKANICPDCVLYIVKNMSVSLFLLYSRGTYVDSLDDSFDFLFCRECISVTNPYCAWHSGTCIQLNSTSKRCFSKRLIFYKVTFVQSYSLICFRPYLQDLENGDYSKICPQSKYDVFRLIIIPRVSWQ